MTHDPFRSAAARERYLAAYDRALDLWPIDHQRTFVPGRSGRTHVVTGGDPAAPPLVLLHGMCLTASMWYSNVAAWGTRRHLIALETIGDRNRSVANQPRFSVAEYVAWFTETIDALALSTLDLLGHSYGGWLALHCALALPRRIRRLVLVDPAASFDPLSFQFILRALPSVFVASDRFAAWYLRWFFRPGFAIPSEVMRLWCAGWRDFRMVALPPTTFTDDELRSLRTPTLLLVGDREVIYRDRTAVLDRARRLVPTLEAEWVPDAAHVPTMERPDLVNDRVLAFLDGGAASLRPETADGSA